MVEPCKNEQKFILHFGDDINDARTFSQTPDFAVQVFLFCGTPVLFLLSSLKVKDFQNLSLLDYLICQVTFPAIKLSKSPFPFCWVAWSNCS